MSKSLEEMQQDVKDVLEVLKASNEQLETMLSIGGFSNKSLKRALMAVASYPNVPKHKLREAKEVELLEHTLGITKLQIQIYMMGVELERKFKESQQEDSTDSPEV